MTDETPAGLLIREAVPADAPYIAALLTQLGYPATGEEVSQRLGYWARIESLVVDQSARGSGIGRVLVAAAEEAARRWGCLRMEVTSARQRAGAHAFYRQLGYLDHCDQSGRFLKPLS